MKYYLVALFDDESYKNINSLQRNLSKKFKANRNSPIPYILLEVIDNPNIEKLDSTINKIIKPYKYFKVDISKTILICESTKTLNLKVIDLGYIKRLNRLTTDLLKLHGFNIKKSNSDLNLTLANMNFLNKDTSKKTYPDADFRGKSSTLKVNRIELWKISNSRRETLIQTYPLKTF